MREEYVRVLLYEPQEDVKETLVENELSKFQDLVGGYIECISPFNDMDVDLICNEEGKLINLRPNRRLSDKETREVYDIICGSFFLVSFDDEGNFKSLSDEQIDKIKSEYRVTISTVWMQ